MASVWLDPPVQDILDGLRANPALSKLVTAIDVALDLLEEEPGSADARKHRYDNGMWVFTFAVPGDRWMMTWWERDDPPHAGDPYVTYIGPIFTKRTPGR